jgi:hypothetical protein
MYHPLYPVARRLVGRPVNVYHRSGTVYCGVLNSVAHHGVYVSPCVPRTRVISADGSDAQSEHALLAPMDEVNPELAYSPGAFFAFGALTGLALGALASPYWW